MTTSPNPLLRANLKSLRLPTMLGEHDKLARDAAASNQTFEDYLLRLTELELAARSANALTARIKNAGFPVLKELDSYDFSALPTVAWWVVWARAKPTWPSAWVWPPVVSRSEFVISRPRPWSISLKRSRSSTSWTACWGNWTMSSC